MAQIQAIPTFEGFELLQNFTKDSIGTFCVVGSNWTNDSSLDMLVDSPGTTYEQIENFVIYESTISRAFFDEYGQLTFELLLPFSLNLEKYIYGFCILHTGDIPKIAAIAKTPKIQKIEGVGGTILFKISISGEAGKIIFKDGAFVTEGELQSLRDEFTLEIESIDAYTKSEVDAKLIHKADKENTYTKSEVDAMLTSGIPAGTILAFAGPTAPDGYLVCNGAHIQRNVYTDLFAAIGTTFGAGDGSTTFALPDLRGEFIRGLDLGRGIDPSRVLGSYQNPTGIHQEVLNAHYIRHVDDEYGSATFTESGFSTAASGTWPSKIIRVRPRNIALLYIIKY